MHYYKGWKCIMHLNAFLKIVCKFKLVQKNIY